MSREDHTPEDTFDPDAALATIRNGTPEGYVWRLKIEEEFGIYTLRIILRRDVWYHLVSSRWHASHRIGTATVEAFHDGVLKAALILLDERAEAVKDIPDWAKLAKQLQDALNGKSTAGRYEGR